MEQLTLDQQRIVSENHNLIYSLANKKSINLDEYYDVLAIGLCKAAIAFDNTKGKFSTLAYTVMLNEYKQELRKQQNERAIPQDKLLSFDVPIQTDQDSQFASFADVIPDNNVQVEQEAIHALTYKSLSSKLKPDEQVIFAILLDDKNQSEIASELGGSADKGLRKTIKLDMRFLLNMKIVKKPIKIFAMIVQKKSQELFQKCYISEV